MKKYRPSNGTEGMLFSAKFCDHCIHDCPSDIQLDVPRCEILANAMCFDIEDPDYPEEWTYDEHGKPVCTKYKYHEWVFDEETERYIVDLPDPEDPNQLKLNL